MLSRFITICLFGMLCVSCSSNIPDIPKTEITGKNDMIEYDGLELSWSEEFDNEGLPDNTMWGYEEGYQRNNELQDYKVADVKYSYMNGGSLVLEVHPDPHEGKNSWTGHPYFIDYSSASLITKDKKVFTKGRLDISARIPVGRGIYPSIRLFSEDENSGFAEIDVMEYVWGNDEMHPKIYSTVNTRENKRLEPRYAYSNTLDKDFHLYSLVLEEDKLQVLFDRDIIYTYDTAKEGAQYWPWDKPFYLSISLAVGGEFGGSSWGVDKNIFPKQMEINYVRYYTPREN